MPDHWLHIRGGTVIDGTGQIDLYASHELRTLIAATNAEKVLRAGVTSISRPGGSYYIGVDEDRGR